MEPARLCWISPSWLRLLGMELLEKGKQQSSTHSPSKSSLAGTHALGGIKFVESKDSEADRVG